MGYLHKSFAWAFVRCVSSTLHCYVMKLLGSLRRSVLIGRRFMLIDVPCLIGFIRCFNRHLHHFPAPSAFQRPLHHPFPAPHHKSRALKRFLKHMAPASTTGPRGGNTLQVLATGIRVPCRPCPTPRARQVHHRLPRCMVAPRE